MSRCGISEPSLDVVVVLARNWELMILESFSNFSDSTSVVNIQSRKASQLNWSGKIQACLHTGLIFLPKVQKQVILKHLLPFPF